MWLYDELQKLFDPPVSYLSSWEYVMDLLCFQSEAIDVDIDEILDMDTDDIRRSHLIVSALRSERLHCCDLWELIIVIMS